MKLLNEFFLVVLKIIFTFSFIDDLLIKIIINLVIVISKV